MLIKKTITEHSAITNWVGKSFWAVMDQGLVATSNFFLNILLARWLIPIEYGAFSVAYTIFLLLSTIHTGMLNEPMLVFGPGKYKGRTGAYLSLLIRGNWIFGIVVGIIFFLVYIIFSIFTGSPLTTTFLGLSIASPFVLFQWLMRRACYINLQPRLAALAGAGYMAFILSTAFGLYSYKCLGPNTALYIMAIASLLSGTWLYFKLELHRNSKQNIELMRDALGAHWRYGRWASVTAAMAWIPSHVFTLFLPIWWGLEASAAYKALLNLLLPMLHVNTALGAILVPIIVGRKKTQDCSHLVFRVTVYFTTATIIYWILLNLFGETIVRFLYVGKYLDYVRLIWMAGIIPVIGALIVIAGAALQALELPEKIFFAYLSSSGFTLTVGLLFSLIWGVTGAMLGWLITYIITASILGLFLTTRLKTCVLTSRQTQGQSKYEKIIT